MLERDEDRRIGQQVAAEAGRFYRDAKELAEHMLMNELNKRGIAVAQRQKVIAALLQLADECDEKGRSWRDASREMAPKRPPRLRLGRKEALRRRTS
jgi:hypothetical protein